ncbi:MAG: alpha/beta hydrolase [Acidimicrobiia bacterium]|nr:alpha/beta hydrolase [Acidimicrobiia bacterium]
MLTFLRVKNPIVIVVLAAALAALGCTARTARVSAIDRLESCTDESSPSDAYCGTLEVFENRKTKQGRKIKLKIVVAPALKRDSAPDPLFVLAGGPGQGAAKMSRAFREIFTRVQQDRDVVLVDQRGTGDSNPLNCEAKEQSLIDLTRSDVFPEQLFRDCLKKYDADPSLYTTPIAMDDLDDVRAFLGYRSINLYGGSYGTRAALVYLRRHPRHTRSIVLDGVAPPDMRLPLYAARDSQRALEKLLADCEADAACRAKFPALSMKLKALLERLENNPARVELTHPRTGVREPVNISRALASGVIMSALYSPTLSSLLPMTIQQAHDGNFQGLLTLGFAFEALGEGMSTGMRLSVLCAEDIPRFTEADAAREVGGSFLGRLWAESFRKPCEFWPKGEIPEDYYKPVESDVPALILSGDLDPITPPSWGDHVAAWLPNSRHIKITGLGHGTITQGCVPQLVKQFLNEGAAAGLDTACLKPLKRPPFFVTHAGPDFAAGAAKQ